MELQRVISNDTFIGVVSEGYTWHTGIICKISETFYSQLLLIKTTYDTIRLCKYKIL